MAHLRVGEIPLMIQWKCERDHLHINIMTNIEMEFLVRQRELIPGKFQAQKFDPELIEAASQIIIQERNE